MSLIRMTEAISVPAKFCTRMEEVPQSLKESFNKFIKPRLKESTDKENLVREVQKLQEKASNGKTKDVLQKVLGKLSESGITSGPTIWKFPVARINDSTTPNQNGRVYNRKLWENVILNQRDVICGGVGLADHPQDDSDPGQFKNASIVWLDMMIDDASRLIYALGSFVGQYGHLAQEILEAGGRVGFSTSGFGELLSDGMTVNPDTYELERVADVVLNPSQLVYGEITDEQPTNIEYTRQQAITESVVDYPLNKKTSMIKKEIEMKADVAQNNNIRESANSKIRDALSAAEVKAFKKYVNQFLEDTSDIKNPIDRLTELNNILELVSSGEISDLQEKVENSLIEERNRLNEMVSQAVSVTEKYDTDIQTFTENAVKVAERAASLESENAHLSERTGMLEEMSVDYEELVNVLTERVQLLTDENSKLKEQVQNIETQFTENLEKERLANNQLTVSNSSLNEEVDHLRRKLLSLEEEADIEIKKYEGQIEGLREKALASSKSDNLKDKMRAKKLENMQESLRQKDKAIRQLELEVRRLDEKLEVTKKLYSKEVENARNLHAEVNELRRANKYLETKSKNSRITHGSSRTGNARELESLTLKYNKEVEKGKSLVEENSILRRKYEHLVNRARAIMEQKKTDIAPKAPQSPMLEAAQSINENVEITHREPVQETGVTPRVDTLGLNLRENKGIEIESYWQDLYGRYGESILPFEKEIRGAKTLREATTNFYHHMNEIDADANKASRALIVEGTLSPADRKAVLREAGFEETTPENETAMEASARFASMKPKGWK